MKNQRIITEGALLLAIFIVLLLVTLYVPLLGVLAMVALPIPFILMTARRGWKAGLFLLAGATVLSLAVGLLLALPLAFLFASSGIVIGILLEKKKSAFAVLVASSLTYIANFLLLYVFTIVVLGFNIVDSLDKAFDDMIITTETVMEALGQQDIEKVISDYEKAMELVPYMIPSMIVFIGIFFAFITLMVAAPIVKRFYTDLPKATPFRDWNFPKIFIWYYIIVILLSFMSLEVGSLLFIAVINLQIMLEFILLIQGLTFIYFYFHVKEKGKAIPVTITVIALLFPPLLAIIRILGIIDLGFELKAKIKNSKNVN